MNTVLKKPRKQLKAVFSNHEHKPTAKTVMIGDTADFAHPRGFVVQSEDELEPGGYALGLYPIIDGDSYRNLEGKLLTVIDASLSGTQGEAAKSLLKDKMREWHRDKITGLQVGLKNSTQFDINGKEIVSKDKYEHQ